VTAIRSRRGRRQLSRLRPHHDVLLDLVDELLQYCRGRDGFVPRFDGPVRCRRCCDVTDKRGELLAQRVDILVEILSQLCQSAVALINRQPDDAGEPFLFVAAPFGSTRRSARPCRRTSRILFCAWRAVIFGLLRVLARFS
jgi:hypothetical protein